MNKLHLLLLALFFQFGIQAQESNNKWNLNVMLSHYERQNENELNLGKVGFNINPGIEVLYNYGIQNSLFLSTGISYQYVSLVSHIESSDRFQVGEMSIPALCTVKGISNSLSVTAGLYGGKFVHFSWQQRNGPIWEDVNKNNRSAYSDDSFFMDSYLDLGYTNNKGLSIKPFIRYRFKENWMEHYRKSFYFGIKFSINFNGEKD